MCKCIARCIHGNNYASACYFSLAGQRSFLVKYMVALRRALGYLAKGLQESCKCPLEDQNEQTNYEIDMLS